MVSLNNIILAATALSAAQAQLGIGFVIDFASNQAVDFLVKIRSDQIPADTAKSVAKVLIGTPVKYKPIRQVLVDGIKNVQHMDSKKVLSLVREADDAYNSFSRDANFIPYQTYLRDNVYIFDTNKMIPAAKTLLGKHTTLLSGLGSRVAGSQNAIKSALADPLIAAASKTAFILASHVAKDFHIEGALSAIPKAIRG